MRWKAGLERKKEEKYALEDLILTKRKIRRERGGNAVLTVYFES